MDSRALAPLNNLVRAITEPASLSDDAGDGRTLFGHFAVFNQWTEINSLYEGRFLERISPGAFARTIAEHRDRVKVLFDHGKDPSVGNKPLGTITDLREDKTGAYYEVELLDAGYVNDLLPAARAGLLGASFRFSVAAEDRVEPLKSTASNPERLMERTITDVDLYEFGPVAFPAYASATAGVRSGTDDFLDALRNPLFVARLTERLGLPNVEPLLSVLPTASQRAETLEPPAAAEVLAVSDGTAGGQPERKHYPTDPASLAAKRRELETFRKGVGRSY